MHADIYQQAKAELMFNVSFLVYLVCSPLVVYYFVTGDYEKAIPTTVGLICVLLKLVIFKVSKSIWLSAFFLCSVTTLIVCININFNEHAIHLVEPFWMIVIVVFAVFMLGVRWGVFFCALLMSGFAFFVVNRLELNLQSILGSIPAARFSLLFEISAALFTLIYILSMFVVTTRKSEQALRAGNQNLETQNTLVNKQNSEITILLKEIHHRVKNNLQVINSLLRLQSIQIHDEESRKVFEDAQYRIKAIALIHERMYKSADLSDINTNDYFKELARDLLRQNVTNQQIGLTVEVDLPGWNQDIVVPLGLLLNELIANSIEHGKLSHDGHITIRLKMQKEGVWLHYADNGHGFAQGYSKGFGLELIETLCDQLNGTMTLQTDQPGVVYDFLFK